MVSLRRRRLLGLCSGLNSVLNPLPKSADDGTIPESSSQNAKTVSVHPVLSDDVTDVKQPQEATVMHLALGVSNVSGSSSSKDQNNQPVLEQTIKRRKRHRRKPNHNHEPCVMRGVYFKNMKWQAAIKVDKKQIHLGTVSSQEEAAHLYDRAAFMCGREPNFELSEEEKQELRKFNWEEFLAMTRRAITSKKQKRKVPKKETLSQNSDQTGEKGMNGFSTAEED